MIALMILLGALAILLVILLAAVRLTRRPELDERRSHVERAADRRRTLVMASCALFLAGLGGVLLVTATNHTKAYLDAFIREGMTGVVEKASADFSTHREEGRVR